MYLDGKPQASSTISTTELISRIQAGDRRAEGELVERHSRVLRESLRRLTLDPSLREDLYQETFRVVIEKLRHGGLDEPDKLVGFIFRTARNLFFRSGRKWLRGEADGAAQLPDPAPGQLDRLLVEERAQVVHQLLDEMSPDRYRQILLRFYVAEEDKQRICRDLGLTALHFNRLLFRARQRFRQVLERSEQRSH